MPTAIPTKIWISIRITLDNDGERGADAPPLTPLPRLPHFPTLPWPAGRLDPFRRRRYKRESSASGKNSEFRADPARPDICKDARRCWIVLRELRKTAGYGAAWRPR